MKSYVSLDSSQRVTDVVTRVSHHSLLYQELAHSLRTLLGDGTHAGTGARERDFLKESYQS